jgi:hypothetical protein
VGCTAIRLPNPIAEDRTVAVESQVHHVPLVAEDFDPFEATL